MRSLFLCLAVIAAFISAPMLAAEMTVTGELVDHACYQGRGAADGTGAGHASCAQTCAKKGQQVALVTEGGDVYLLAGEVVADSNSSLVPHMGHVVEVTGDITEADGSKTITTDTIKHISVAG